MTDKKQRKAPVLRFKGFTNDWEQHTLGDFGSVAMNKRIFKNQTTDKGDVPFFKISTFGKKADSFISNNLFEKYKEKYPYPQKGDLLISASGSIGRIVEYKGQKAYYQDSNIVWLNHNKELLNIYLKAYYQIIHWHGIEGSTIKRLYNKNILATSIFVPDKKEQYELGKLIKKAEKIISLQQRKLKKIKLLKRAMLQNLFTCKSFPKVRFKGFLNAWEQCNLGEIAQIIGGGTPSTKNPEYWNGSINWYSPIEIGKNIYVSKSNKKITKLGLQYSSAKMLPGKRTILFTSRAGIGDMAIMLTDGCTNQGFQSWVINDQITNIYFLFSLGSFIKKEVIRKASGSTFLEISNKEIKKIKIFIPNKKEQDCIGKLIQMIDILLSLQQQKVKELQQTKEFLLQNMFI